ncbi:uncharacterized protein FIBRA_09185 [Fibroporia radiculosa]|uniref:Uncharacterized protein n=1 Tax=Fibroporia radiculosa TaxID=599839 RepID=J7RH35_9APHY|nr:uncharacterized protein FIBRA_09185 [Fibroporia radiculosa]CCM06877.1 predicted protein [Fibroporia radiculosa]
MSAYGHDGLSAHKLSPFDPAFPAHAYNTSPYALSPPPSYPSRSSRDLNTVPWSVDPADADLPIDPALKEERIRMLEAEFGTKQAPQDEGEKVGSVDANGNLITDGPRKRLAVRCIEILLALTASAASIYTALASSLPLLTICSDHQTTLSTSPREQAPRIPALRALLPDSALHDLPLHDLPLLLWSAQGRP